MKKIISVLILGTALAVPFYADSAIADGPEQAYEVPAGSLDPGEYLDNVDGAKEDPNAKMSDVARAYRNGRLAGLQAAQEAQRKAQVYSVPPLPPGMMVSANTPVQSTQEVVSQDPAHPGVQTITDEYHYKVVHQVKNLNAGQYIQEQQVRNPPAQVQQPQYARQADYTPPEVWVQQQMNQPQPVYVPQPPVQMLPAPVVTITPRNGYYRPYPVYRTVVVPRMANVYEPRTGGSDSNW
jgi:hypothetical protein